MKASWSEIFDERQGEDSFERFERIAKTFHDETGYLRPGKACVIYPTEVRRAAYETWVSQKAEELIIVNREKSNG